MKTASKVFRFERNELDLGRYELRRGNIRLPLPRIPMELLIVLVEQHGRLVTREEIAARLWPDDTSVDVEQGINAAVKRIRAVLNDNAARPRFVETVVGKGYRFIAKVEEIEPQATQAAAPAPPASHTAPLLAETVVISERLPGGEQARRAMSWRWIVVASLTGIGIAAWYGPVG